STERDWVFLGLILMVVFLAIRLWLFSPPPPTPAPQIFVPEPYTGNARRTFELQPAPIEQPPIQQPAYTRIELSPRVRAMGNIAPYRKDMFVRIGQNWHPAQKNQSIIGIITLNHDGKLLSDEILQSSGNKKSDKEALAAIEATEFAALPD